MKEKVGGGGGARSQFAIWKYALRDWLGEGALHRTNGGGEFRGDGVGSSPRVAVALSFISLDIQ